MSPSILSSSTVIHVVSAIGTVRKSLEWHSSVTVATWGTADLVGETCCEEDLVGETGCADVPLVGDRDGDDASAIAAMSFHVFSLASCEIDVTAEVRLTVAFCGDFCAGRALSIAGFGWSLVTSWAAICGVAKHTGRDADSE